jgi:ABC-type amino acid transport substrate-binding protein
MFILLLIISIISYSDSKIIADINVLKKELIRKTLPYDGNYEYLDEAEKQELDLMRKRPIIIGINSIEDKNGELVPDKKDYDMSSLYKVLLEKHLGVKVEFKYDTWGNLVDGLKNGDIDILLGMTPTSDRKIYINFTVPYSPDTGVLVMPFEYEINYFEDLKGKTVYLVHGSTYEEIGKKKGKKYGFKTKSVKSLNYDIVDENNFIFDSKATVSRMIQNNAKGLKYETLYYEKPIAIGVSKARGDLFYSVINKSFEEVLRAPISKYINSSLVWEERKKLFDQNLTSEERAFLKNKKTLDVYLEYEFFPQSFYDEDTKEFKGIQVDILKEISEVIGLRLNILNNGSKLEWSEINNLFEQGNGDLLIVYQTLDRRNNFLFSQPTSQEEILLVGDRYKTENLNEAETHLDYKIGVLKDDGTRMIAEKIYDKNNFMYANSIDQLLKF